MLSPQKNYIILCDGEVFIIDRSLLMGAKISILKIGKLNKYLVCLSQNFCLFNGLGE